MIGNDIVDLKYISKTVNWKRPRFIDKVFTSYEQMLIVDSKNQHQMIWRLWSMKEAAYKAHVQTHNIRFFNPKVIACEIYSETKGSASIFNSKYVTSSECNEHYIYTSASQKDNLKVSSSVIKVNDYSFKFQSAFLKHKVLEYISKSQNRNLFDLSVSKNQNSVPMIFENEKQLPLNLSLTHCGCYLAFSVLDC